MPTASIADLNRVHCRRAVPASSAPRRRSTSAICVLWLAMWASSKVELHFAHSTTRATAVTCSGCCQHRHVWQAAVALLVVQPVPDHELVGNLEPDVSDRYLD